ncbi:MAG: SGNH/GDSL hydrolase family protein [Ktedonobacteraceae bacterium]
MKIYTRIAYLAPLLLCLLTFLSVACGASNPTNTLVAPTPTAAQPVTAQQILSMPVTYVALGASDAVGVGSNEPGSQGYVPLLATRLQKGSHLINLGISGIRLHEALTQELPLALNTSPNLVTIWLVANDFVGGVQYDGYMKDLAHLLQQLRASTKARIVMANLPDLTRLPAFSGQSASQKAKTVVEIQRWNAAIATIAARYDVTLVDLFSHQSQLTTHPEYISGDGFHPSPAGYVQLSNYFWDAIKA